MRRYKNAKAALRSCLDAGVRSASAINRERQGDKKERETVQEREREGERKRFLERESRERKREFRERLRREKDN